MKIPRRTSVTTCHEIRERGLLRGVRWRAYEALFSFGPLTGAELNQELAHDDRVPGYHKRLSELKDLGVVYEVEERECTVTGRQAIAWDVTEHLPKSNGKRYQRPTPAEIAAALGELENWRKLAMLPGFPMEPNLEKVIHWLRRKAN